MFKTVKRKVQIEDSTVNEGSQRRSNCQWRFMEKIQLSMKVHGEDSIVNEETNFGCNKEDEWFRWVSNEKNCSPDVCR
jgi:hypothetical protein